MTALVAFGALLEHPDLFGRWFGSESWRAWRAVLKGAFAEPLTSEERQAFRELTERDPPVRKARELWVKAGRRAGKDSIASVIAVHSAAFTNYAAVLRPGERATILCLACDRAQAQIVMRYIRGYFAAVPALAAMVTRETADTIELDNGAEIIVGTNDFRLVRGRTVVCVIFDEVAFWRSEDSASPDFEVYQAVVPALATVPDAILVAISSPYRKAGLLYKKVQRHAGKDVDDVLVVQATSRQLNPTLDQRIVDAAMEADPDAARAEWLGEFRNDIADFVSRQVVEACIEPGCHERPPVRAAGVYRAFVDAAGGSGGDSMTLAISHLEGSGTDRIPTLDAVRERKPPFSPDDVTAEFAGLMKSYSVSRATSDRWGGDWVVEAFRKHGVTVEPSAEPKADIYREILPLLNAKRCLLLDHPRLVAQLCSLERRVARGGRDSIDHPAGGHDDLANAVAGSLLLANTKRVMHISQAALDRLGIRNQPPPSWGVW